MGISRWWVGGAAQSDGIGGVSGAAPRAWRRSDGGARSVGLVAGDDVDDERAVNTAVFAPRGVPVGHRIGRTAAPLGSSQLQIPNGTLREFPGASADQLRGTMAVSCFTSSPPCRPPPRGCPAPAPPQKHRAVRRRDFTQARASQTATPLSLTGRMCTGALDDRARPHQGPKSGGCRSAFVMAASAGTDVNRTSRASGVRLGSVSCTVLDDVRREHASGAS